MKRLFAFLVVAAALLAAWGLFSVLAPSSQPVTPIPPAPEATPARRVTPAVALTPGNLRGGEPFTVTGTGWQSGVSVTVSLRPGSATIGVPFELVQVVADGQGNFSYAGMLPPATAAGAWRVSATAGNRPVQIATGAFSVLAPAATQQVVAAVPVSPTDTLGGAEAMTVTLPPESLATAFAGPFTGWRAGYFNNPSLQGEPALTRDDAAIDFNWGMGSPDARVIPDNFSARWVRALWFDTGSYLFTLRVDDGGRVLVDGLVIIDQWLSGAVHQASAEVELSAGDHDVQVDYFDSGGAAAAYFSVGVLMPPALTSTVTPTLSPTVSPTLSPQETPAPSSTAVPVPPPPTSAPPPPTPALSTPALPTLTAPPPTPQPSLVPPTRTPVPPLPTPTPVPPTVPPSSTPIPPVPTPTQIIIPTETSSPPTAEPTPTPKPGQKPKPTEKPK